MKNIVFALILLSFLIACDADYLPDQKPHLVVEGWIEDGDFPVVIVTQSIPMSEDYTSSDSLGNYIVRWATVTVYCGEDSVILTG